MVAGSNPAGGVNFQHACPECAPNLEEEMTSGEEMFAAYAVQHGLGEGDDHEPDLDFPVIIGRVPSRAGEGPA